MAASKSDTDVTAILAAARRQDLQFAILQSKGGCVLQAHKSKSVDAMRKAARSDGGGAKGAWGKMRLNGNLLVLTCDVAPPGNFAKEIKKFFSDAGHNLRVEFVDAAEGEAPEPDAGEESPAGLKGQPKAERRRGREGDEGMAEDDPHPPSDAAGSEDEDADSDSIADIFAVARKRAVNFAWLVGSEGLVFRAHRKKKPDALIKAAKKAGGGPRGAAGQMSVSGKLITLVCAEAPPGNFLRLARERLKSDGLQYKIEIVLPDEGVPQGADPAEAATSRKSEPAVAGSVRDEVEIEAVQARYRDVFERIKPVLATGSKPEKDEIKKALGDYKKAVLSGDTSGAAAVLDRLERRTAGPAAGPGDAPEKGQATPPGTPVRRIVDDAGRRDRLVTKTPPHNQAGKALVYEAVEPIELHVRIRAPSAKNGEPV